MQNQPLLKMQNISKSFPGVKALNQVSLTVYGGTVHALMGENGAGKSTLMKCLFGMYEKDSGTVLLQNKPVHFKNAGEALKNGVAMVHQELNQALQRSVADNLWLGRYPKKGWLVDTKKMLADTQKLFQNIGFSVDPNRIMATMSVSQRQMAEIAKAISYDAKILVFDEPTSSLNEAEVNRLFSIIRMLKQRGCGIIYISHKMAEILKISDTVTVLRDGCHVATKPAADLTTDVIIQLMVGRKLSNQFPPKTNLPGAVALKVEHLTARHNALFDVSFEARQGEILGIAGLDGSGRTELLENLFGISARKSGAIYLHGQKIENRTPREAIHSGFALITEERRASGIFGNLGILDNTVISALKKHRKFGLLREKSMRRDTDWSIRTLHIKTPNQKTKIRTLSGGNQQKVIFGRWLLTKPEILLLDEPTRGIDVGAKYEIYSLIMQLAQNGKTVLLVSSEMPELLGLCDRILVMSGGRLAGAVNAKTATQEEMMRLASKYV